MEERKIAEEGLVPCTAVQVRPGVWRFDDESKASFYLLEGETMAVAVDTGLSDGRLMPVLRRFTDLPIALVVTHGHGDHLAHADEFDTAYLAPEDVPFLQTAAERLAIHTAFSPDQFLPLRDGQKLELGGVVLEVVSVPGHSVGSVALYDRKHGLMFSGDAFGSGWAVFMQLPGGASVSQYRAGLRHFLKYCGELPQEPEFMTGHYDQRHMGEKDNPVCLALIRDMEALCTQVLEKQVELEPVKFYAHAEEPEYLARHGRAAMVVSPSKIG